MVKLWDLISQYKRQRAANLSGQVRCYTCPRIYRWEDMHLGHGLPRTRGKATFFEENNLRVQCPICNGPGEGMPEVFKSKIDKELGKGTWDAMVQKSRTTVKYSRAELIDMIRDYRTKIKELNQ